MRIAVLAYSGCMATQLFGIADVLRIAGDLDARMGARRGVSLQVETVGLAGRIVTLAGGLEVRPKRPAGQYDLLVVPGLEPTRDRDWALALTELAPQCRFLQQCFARGTTVASICTGAFVLGEAGLLNGHNVTTAWLFAADLAARYPEARVNAEAIVLQDGAIITTAAVSSAFDLAIHLIKLYLGAEVATATAAVTLLSAPRTSQSPYVDAALIATEQPTFARNLLRWFEPADRGVRPRPRGPGLPCKQPNTDPPGQGRYRKVAAGVVAGGSNRAGQAPAAWLRLADRSDRGGGRLCRRSEFLEAVRPIGRRDPGQISAATGLKGAALTQALVFLGHHERGTLF